MPLYELWEKRVVMLIPCGESPPGGGGGPGQPPGGGGPGQPPGYPSYPIYGPPGTNFPDKPGYPPTVGGGPIYPPPGGGGGGPPGGGGGPPGGGPPGGGPPVVNQLPPGFAPPWEQPQGPPDMSSPGYWAQVSSQDGEPKPAWVP